MRFMNEWDISRAADRYATNDTPNLRAAVLTLEKLQHWTNRNSDGWAYWPKPARAAAKLMALIEGDGTYAAICEREEHDVTSAALRAALSPVKAFLTRQGVDHADIIVPVN